MASSSTTTTVDRRHLYTETNRILNANTNHFLTLSLLFLPLAFAASQSHSTSIAAIETLITSPQTLFSVKTLIAILAYVLVVIPGVAMITYSANQAISHKPLTFSSTVKSLSHSYIPLLSTSVAGLTKLTLVAILFTVSAIGITEAVKLLGLHFDYAIVIYAIASYATVISFIGIWGLAAAITVVESKLGFVTLKQSADRLSEFRSVSFSIGYVNGFVIVTFSMLNSIVVPKIGSAILRWAWILQVFAICSSVSMLFSHYVVLNTVLYGRCKAASGEEIVEATAASEVSGEYVSLVADEEDKVKGQGSMAETNGGFFFIMLFFAIVGIFVVPHVYIILGKNPSFGRLRAKSSSKTK